MGGFDVGFAGALLAGILSFLSPCVLPLVPPYLCFLGGVTFDQLTGEEAADRLLRRRVLYASAAFVLGFMTVFTLLGATVTVLGQLVAEYSDVFAVVAGAVIIVMGLHFVGLVRIPFLYREARFHVEARPVGLIGAFVVGLAFAFGWTPCVGPVLATILWRRSSWFPPASSFASSRNPAANRSLRVSSSGYHSKGSASSPRSS